MGVIAKILVPSNGLKKDNLKKGSVNIADNKEKKYKINLKTLTKEEVEAGRSSAYDYVL